MEILESIKARRTIRRFKPDPIPPPVLDEIFEAAMWAPSPANAQPWDFFVVGPQARGKLLPLFQAKAAELLAAPDLPEPKRQAVEALRADFGGAPYMVAVISRPGSEPIERIEYPLSTAAAVQNLCLAAWAHGIGSIWLSFGAAPPVKPTPSSARARSRPKASRSWALKRAPLWWLSWRSATRKPSPPRCLGRTTGLT